jgi:AcrR family transcriptional regulator
VSPQHVATAGRAGSGDEKAMSTMKDHADATATYAIDFPPLADTSMLRDPPPTARGVRTRAALIEGARRVFQRSGYLDAQITDITKAARCSTGTFYTYFSNKDEILQAVLEQVQDDMLHPGIARLDDDSEMSPYALIEASNRAYLRAYQRNAKLMMLLEQVAIADPNFRETRRRRGQAFVVRNAHVIADLQKRGLADPRLDAYQASRALSAMMSRVAYFSFCLGDDTPIEVLVETSTRIWANALKLPTPT